MTNNNLLNTVKDKLLGLRVGFYLLIVAFVLTLVGFFTFLQTYEVFGYKTERVGIALTILGLWFIFFMLANAFVGGNKPKWVGIFYAIVTAFFVIAMLEFLTPCLSPIGIYFTVNNMGDVQANAIGVPKAITATVCYVVATLLVMASSFLNLCKQQKEETL